MIETDAEFRERLRYVAADGALLTRLVETLTGEDLDSFADIYGLKRRPGTPPPPFSF